MQLMPDGLSIAITYLPVLDLYSAQCRSTLSTFLVTHFYNP